MENISRQAVQSVEWMMSGVIIRWAYESSFNPKPIPRGLGLWKCAFLLVIAAISFCSFRAEAREITVLTPSVTYNAGLVDLAMKFSKETGVNVVIKRDPMAKMVDDAEHAT